MSFNTSTRKEDVSLKLRAVNLHKARDETKQLEEESRKMEERLRELKMAMTREKEEREQAQSGFWNKGKQGTLTNYAQEVLSKPKLKAQKPKKVKVLKDEPITPPVRIKVPGTVGFIAQRGHSNKENKIHGPKCGQCEQKAAQVSCLECGEEYCASCFAAFHLRGNLKKHRSVPVGAKVSRTPRANITPRKPNLESDKPKPHSNGRHVMFSEYSPEQLSPAPTLQNGNDRSLLDGEYNEAESSAAFQQAVEDWRGGDSAATKQQVYQQPVSPVRSPVVSIEHGTSTDSSLQSKMPDITFHSSLTYAEKLMLKRHRRTELQPLSDDLRSKSETGSRSPEQMISTRSELNGEETPEETLVQVLSEPMEEENEGIQWQDIHRAMNSDSMIRCDSRSESRLSIIELEDEQPVKSRRQGRGVDVTQTSTYNVSEVGYEEDMEILSARKKSARSARKTRLEHRLSSARKQHSANHPPSVNVSQQSSSRRVTSAAQPIKVQNEEQPTEMRIQLNNDSNEKRPRPSSRPKSRSKPLSSRPKSSRANQSRPHSRAMSRTETRLTLFGEGELTKRPSEALKEVSRMTPRHDPVPFLPTMGEFFTFGSEVTGNKPTSSRVMTPNDTKRLMGDKKESTIPKWKVSYNLYNMGPRSWKPEKSLKDQVADGEVAEMVEEISEKLQMFLAPDDDHSDDIEQGMEVYSADKNSMINNTTGTTYRNRDEYASRQWSSPASNDTPTSEPSKIGTPREIRSQAHTNMQQISTTPNRMGSRSHNTERPLSKLSKPGTPSEITSPRSARNRDIDDITSRPESRAIVVDGDDLTCYDFEENVREQDAEDEKSWYQLEWELASHDGRITDDGQVSRMSLLASPEVDESAELHEQQEETSFSILQQDTGHLSPGASLDLRMNNLMEDFEEMEQKMNDEEDVKALTS